MTIDIISELTKIAKVERSPEEQAALVKLLAEKLPKGVVQEARKAVLAQECHEFSVNGYKAHYELFHGFAPPPHVVDEVNEILEDHKKGMGSVIFAARGFWKTVSISVTFLSWFIGLFPKKTNLVIAANDDSAEKITKAVAAIIEFHPEWKRAYPNVIPDTGKWSVEGFYVIDTNVSREEWARVQAAKVDPTFVGGGYKSSRLNGKHPDGMLIPDDVHDRGNSASERERKEVIEIVTRVILKTAMRIKDKLETIIVSIATPWATDDVNQFLKNTGEFGFINIPAAVRANEGDKGAVYCDGVSRDGTVIYEDIIGWWIFRWTGYGVGSFKADRATLGKSSFWQMIMLDLATSATGRMKYYEYPADQIDEGWIVLGGADPTNSDNESETGGSHFALAFIAKIPTGGAVVIDGVLERCSQLKAENYILAAQNRFSNWQFTAVEAVGGGLGFIQTLQRNANIRIVASGLKGISDAKVRSKKDRWLNDGAKWFEDGTVKISNADTPFLNALRRMFDKIHDLDPKTDYAFDAGDATYHALKSMPDVLQIQNFTYAKRERGHNPITGIGAYSGYGR